MGMYTEIYVNVDLKPETPEEVLSVLRAMCGGKDKYPLAGKPQLWQYLFKNALSNTSCAILTQSTTGQYWSLLAKGDIKNYNREIEKFFEWIMPWVYGDEGDFIGHHRYEEDQLPCLVTLKACQNKQ